LAKLDRYILSQLMGPFAIFSLILIGVYWVGRSIGLFDEMIGNGQSVLAFFQIMILFLPQLVSFVLPVVAFAAAIYVSNRLHSESEMVVMQAAGLTPYRIFRPFLIFAFLVSLLASILSNYLVPVSLLRLSEKQHELSQDMASRMIGSGKFIHPIANVTFFVREVTNNGSLLNIFLFDQRSSERDVTYTANKAVLFNVGGAPRLVMYDGLIQTLEKKHQLLSKVQFKEFVFDVGALVGKKANGKRSQEEFSTLSLLFPTKADLAATGRSAADLGLVAHRRIEQPIQSLIYPLIGMTVLLLGGFSRFGMMRQILMAVAIVIFLSALSVPFRGMMQRDPVLWWLIYVPDLLGAFAIFLMLFKGTRNTSSRYRRRMAARGGAA